MRWEAAGSHQLCPDKREAARPQPQCSLPRELSPPSPCARWASPPAAQPPESFAPSLRLRPAFCTGTLRAPSVLPPRRIQIGRRYQVKQGLSEVQDTRAEVWWMDEQDGGQRVSGRSSQREGAIPQRAVYLQSRGPSPLPTPGTFNQPPENPETISSHSPFPLSPTNLLSVSMNLPILDISHKWNQTTFDLSCLASFHSACSQESPV